MPDQLNRIRINQLPNSNYFNREVNHGKISSQLKIDTEYSSEIQARLKLKNVRKVLIKRIPILQTTNDGYEGQK